MRTLSILIVALAVLTVFHLSQGSPTLASPTKTATTTAAATQQPAGQIDLHCQGTPLGEVIQELRQQSGNYIFVHWPVLDPFRITESLPITLDLTGGLTLDEALTRLLEHVGSRHVHLDHQLIDGVFTISTFHYLNHSTDLRVYDIRNAFADNDHDAQTVERVIRRVQGLDPLSWSTLNKNRHTVRELNRNLIIKATPEMHALINRELADILPQ